jgi:hypothetical protein
MSREGPEARGMTGSLGAGVRGESIIDSMVIDMN